MNLLPGRQSKLAITVIEKFGAHFAPGTTILYLGDKANKFVIYEQERLKQLGVPIISYHKPPDIILYNEVRNWLFLIEAGILHKAVTLKRRKDLESLLIECKAFRIYVSAFRSYSQYRQYSSHVAWKTHIWIAAMPEHMIHYNGENFLGPYE